MICRRLLIGTASLFAIAAPRRPRSRRTSPPPRPALRATTRTIVVTGIRGSVSASIEAKRDSDVVADFLTAEDIGQFPDRNVAEALQRVPGIVINREFGEGERVSLRGTAPNLTRTLVNGHAIATADWFMLEQLAATRSFNYLTLPSEIVGRLDVYKSPTADIEEGGIGGTINVHTRKPLDLDPFDRHGLGRDRLFRAAQHARPAGLRPDQLAQRGRRPSASSSAASTSAATSAATASRCSAISTRTATRPGDALIPSLIGSALFVQERERYGGNIALQFRPTDDARDQRHRPLFEVRRRQLQPELSRLGHPGAGRRRHAHQLHRSRTAPSFPAGSIPRRAAAPSCSTPSTATPSPRPGRRLRPDLAAHRAQGTLHFQAGYTEAHGDTESSRSSRAARPAASPST